MSYRTNNPTGGVRYLACIQCHLCGGTTPGHEYPNQAWDEARRLGWHCPLNAPLKPECPDCHAGVLGRAS